MLKKRLAVITCVMITVLCGCNGSAKEEISDIIMSYMQAHEQETEETGESAGKEELAKAEVPDIYYAYHSLDEEGKRLYLEILDALENMSAEADVSTLDIKQLKRIFECVVRDHPELFYVEGFQYTEHFLADKLTKLSFEGIYSETKQDAEILAAEIERKLAECMDGVLLAGQAPSGEDEYSAVKYLYEYLIGNTEYDKDADNNQNIRSVFLDGRSVCQGYAKAMQYMLQKAGIQSFLVTGYTGGERHAWNLVRVNGQYYYLDPTWGDASYSYSGSEGIAGHAFTAGMEEDAFYPLINYDYFLVTTDEISKTHSFEDFLELPLCGSIQDNYYVREGLFFESYDRGRLENIFNSDDVKTADYVTLKCANQEVYEQMRSAIIDEQQIFGIIKSDEGSISYASNEELCTISFWNIYY